MFGRRRAIGFGLAAHRRARGTPLPSRPRFAGFQALGRRQTGLRTGLASLALHALVIGLAVWLTRADRPSVRASANQSHPPQAVTMVYVPPKEMPDPPKPEQRQPPAAPAPVKPAPAPAPKIPLPVAAVTRDIPEHDQPAATGPEQSSRHETARRAEAEDPMVLEARRIFGRKDTGPPGAMAGPLRDGQPIRTVAAGGRCAWGDAPPENDGTPAQGVVEGIVRSESDGRPLPGAFLQLLGTGSATFSDNTGHYHLIFDAALVDRCRSQVVRVSAPGYRARTMVLAYGAWSDNRVDMAVR